MISNQFQNFLENVLSWSARRQEAVSANIANIDTPGYRSKDYSFQQEMDTIGMAATSDKHMMPAEMSSSANIFEVESRVQRDNGNNVDLDREMTEMAKNGLQYITVIQILNQKMRTLRSSIQEGGQR